MATKKDTTKTKQRKGARASKSRRKSEGDSAKLLRFTRFRAEQLRLEGSESRFFPFYEGAVAPAPRPIHCIEELMWMKQSCSSGNPCSPRRTCALHLEHVELWSNPDFKLTTLEGSDRRQRYHDIQKITRQPFFKHTEKMRGMVDAHPEEWPGNSSWKASQIEFRDAVNRIIGTDPRRAAALSGVLRMLKVTPNIPANFQYKMATMAIETTWTLQALFEKAMNMGISIGELNEVSPWV